MGTSIVFLKEKKLKNPVLFTGLPGIGLVGKICVDYLLKQFKAERVAVVVSDSFPPSVHTKDSVIDLIQDELYCFSFNNRDYVFLAGPVQPSLDFRVGSSSEHYEFAARIVEVAKKLGVKMIVTLAGINIGQKRMEKKPQVIVAATSKETLKKFTDLGAIADKKEGLISGAAGLIVGIGKQNGIEGACLMGETNASLIYGDHSASKKIIELLVNEFGFSVDMKGIEKESRDIETAFQNLSQQLEQAEEDEDEQRPTYVR